MTRADDLKIIALPAGNYKWSHLSFGTRYINFDPSYGFKVTAGTITYIGDLNTELEVGVFSAAAKFRVTNDSKNIKEEINKDYPKLIEKYPFIEQMTVLRTE